MTIIELVHSSAAIAGIAMILIGSRWLKLHLLSMI